MRCNRAHKRLTDLAKLEGKHIILGVTGSVAIYKSLELARLFIKRGASVKVVMTRCATELVSPHLFESLIGNRVYTELFPKVREDPFEHISLADWGDVFVIAPATANFIGKSASGIADDLISTTFLTADFPVVIAPAMNARMWLNPAVQENVKILRKRGIIIVDPGSGELACGDKGPGRLAEIEDIFDVVVRATNDEKPLAGKKVLVTAGATREYIDDVRFISNPSTGKMGFALAKSAYYAGAEVILIYGQTEIKPPSNVRAIQVISAEDMARAVDKEFSDSDILIMSSAVSDWTIDKIPGKIKKENKKSLSLELKPTSDILKSLRKKKGKRIFAGFAVEIDNDIENARKKFSEKNLDIIFVNNPKNKGSAFGTDTNSGFLITRTGIEKISLMTKESLAEIIIDKLSTLL